MARFGGLTPERLSKGLSSGKSVVDIKRAQKVLNELNYSVNSKAISAAVRGTEKKAKKTVVRVIRKKATMQKAAIIDEVRVYAKNNMGMPGIEVVGIGKKRPRTGLQFKVLPSSQTTSRPQPGKGLKFSLYKGERMVYKRGFFGRGAQGSNVLPWYREQGGSRDDIGVLYGFTVSSAMGPTGKFGDEMTVMARDILDPYFESRYMRSLRGWAVRNNLI